MEDASIFNKEAEEMLKIHELKDVPDFVHELANQHVKEQLEALSKPIEVPTEPKTHFQYYEPAEGTGGLPAVICTCGQSKRHLRFKVLERWSEKHFNKTGHNVYVKGSEAW